PIFGDLGSDRLDDAGRSDQPVFRRRSRRTPGIRCGRRLTPGMPQPIRDGSFRQPYDRAVAGLRVQLLERKARAITPFEDEVLPVAAVQAGATDRDLDTL